MLFKSDVALYSHGLNSADFEQQHKYTRDVKNGLIGQKFNFAISLVAIKLFMLLSQFMYLKTIVALLYSL